jgi:hypothetical protein
MNGKCSQDVPSASFSFPIDVVVLMMVVAVLRSLMSWLEVYFFMCTQVHQSICSFSSSKDLSNSTYGVLLKIMPL